jgi:hypothetical protein
MIASTCSSPVCAFTTEEPGAKCPRCGAAMRRGDSPARGRLLVILGVFLFLAGGLLAWFVGPLIFDVAAQSGEITGSQAQFIMGLFVIIALMGLVGIGNGAHVLKHGRQHGVLKIMTFVLALAIVAMCITVTTMLRAKT